MINKKSIWFLTLFSLILVLSIYYITMPSELLLNTNKGDNNVGEVTNIDESTVLVALRVESDEEMLKQMETLQSVLTSEHSSVDEKNTAFEMMKNLNTKRGTEETLEKKIKDAFQLDSFIKIKDTSVEVVINKKEHNTTLANNIIRAVQENFENNMYITVKFTT